ncbi:transglycosylase SLT domain-containing protein [Bacteroidales bacterium OttesenSCG-928-M06]|nr:transglycosylase SLT domain-containing protein [Bacteroidales bacterium OttesenSCG-928-M06]
MKRQIILFLLLFPFIPVFIYAEHSLKDGYMGEEFVVVAGLEDIFPDTVGQEYKSNNTYDWLNEPICEPDAWDLSLDSLINSWHVKYYVEKSENPGYQESVTGNDAVYVSRLARLNNIIELPYNEVVRNCINLYVDRRRNSVEYMLGLESFYFPMIEEALDKNGLPDELKYLAVVESGLNPVALSRVGASGLWQFMHATGKQYGLEINSLVDERRDPLKATYAACEYFKDMYRIYGDWTLVIAAYNCGPGNVNKAIRKANGSTDYWKIYPYLPKETRSYVPLFIAATYVMNYYAHHQLYPAKTSLPLATDTVMVEKTIHFDQISEILDVDKELIRALNPQYKLDIVPGHSKSRAIKLPAYKAYAFVELEDTIANCRKNELFANRTYVGENAPNQEKITHRVISGENLHSIGNKYGVTAAEIRKWNGLRTNKVTPGKRLVVYVDNGGYITSTTASSNVNKTSSSVKTSSSKAKTLSSASQKTVQYGTYKVKSGESFYSIAKKYPGCTHADLMKINNIGNEKLKTGQIIKVPKI